jgi:tetratricopeptide (TPR) repeat protein
MRREFVAMESAMQTFIEQPDYPTLILNGSDGDIIFPVRVLQNWDRQWDSPLFLIFPFECKAVGDYIQQCMDLLVLQIEAVNEELMAQGEESWPPLPLVCLDPRQAPRNRLRAAIDYVRSMVPDDADIVWGLLPAIISDPAGYKTMILPLLALTGFEDWMNGHRFLIRDDRSKPFLLLDLQREKADGVLVLNIDFSPGRAADAMVRTVNDPNAAVPERMQALMQLAAFDIAYQRYDQALEKYNLLHTYHAEQKDAVGQALALGGAGDVAMRLGNMEEAKKRYQQALAVAAPDGNLPVLLNLLQSAGECCMHLGQPGEAEGYLDLANQTAGKLISPYAKIQIMEKLGIVQLSQRKAREAAQTWTAAKDLCREFECPELAKSILDRLINLYSLAGMQEQAGEFAQEKKNIAKQTLS